MISPSQRPLPNNTQHSQQTNIHAPGGIRTHDRSRRAAVDLRLRPRGHWDRHVEPYHQFFNINYVLMWGHAVTQLVKALRYKPEGRGFDSCWVIGIFHWHNPSGRTMALGLTHPLREMSTGNISCGVKVAVHLNVIIPISSWYRKCMYFNRFHPVKSWVYYFSTWRR